MQIIKIWSKQAKFFSQIDAEAAAPRQALHRAPRPSSNHGQQPAGKTREELRGGGQGASSRQEQGHAVEHPVRSPKV